MNFIDLFSGIGGFRLGMERNGHKCVGFCEKDKYARITYKANFDTEGEWEGHDITTVTDDEIRTLGEWRPIEVICGGFPCQAFSVAGNRLGFADTRGTLFFEICRFAEIIKPKYLFLENVKGLLSHDNGRTFLTIINTLDELGYDVEWQLLNSKNYVPQNRERVFIIGHSRERSSRKIFPIARANNQTIKQIIGGSQGYRVYDAGGVSVTLASQAGGMGAKTGLYFVNQPTFKDAKISEACQSLRVGGGNPAKVMTVGNVNPSGNGMNGQVFDSAGLSPTITTNKGEGSKILVRAVLTPDRLEKRQNGRRFKRGGRTDVYINGTR